MEREQRRQWRSSVRTSTGGLRVGRRGGEGDVERGGTNERCGAGLMRNVV